MEPILPSLWDDLRISATMVTVSDFLCTKPPVFVPILHNAERGASYSGICAWKFDRGMDGKGLFQNAYFHAQLPHGYAEGTPVEPHVHVRLDAYSGGRPGQHLLLELEYTWTNIGESSPAETGILPINYKITETDLESDNIMIVFPFLEKPDARISSMLSCRFSRVTIDPSWTDFWTPRGLKNDSFDGALIFKEFDFHYRTDAAGSKRIHEK